MRYILKIFHNDPTTLGGRSEQRSQLRACLDRGSYETLKWNSAMHCPANWVGYTDNNPSPGIDTHYHKWTVDCEREELAMIVLKTGAIIFSDIDSLHEV